MLRFDKAALLFKFILSVTLSNSLWGSDVSLFLINIVSILFYNFIEFIILLYTFLVITFARYKEYIIYLISFSKFSDVLPVFTCASATGNLWKICLGVNILSLSSCIVLYLVQIQLRITIKQFNNFFSWFVKCFNIFYYTFLPFWIFTLFTITFIYDLIFFYFLLLFPVLYDHPLYSYKNQVDL